MLNFYRSGLFVVFALLASVGYAACPALYPNNTPIVITGAVELCNDNYVSLYDPYNNVVILTSEIVHPVDVDIKRSNNFRVDKRVDKRITSKAYLHTGWDRGHMVPADNAITEEQMSQTFLMTNVVPMHPKLNKGRWKALEQTIKEYVVGRGVPTHVLTIALYDTSSGVINGILIPTMVSKVVYRSNETVVFFTANTAQDDLHRISVEAFQTYLPYRIPLSIKRVGS